MPDRSDLWAAQRAERRSAAEPLALRLRPRTLDEFVGQAHVLGPGKLLRRMLDAERLSSLILFGPPGTGKTTLAEVIANTIASHFERANAALVGVRDVRRMIDEAARRLEETDRRTILFLDEIHRFARNQQDVLLHDVERGTIILIGATTENPYFAVNSPLLSRATMIRFEPLAEAEIEQVLRRALADERGYGGQPVTVHDEAIAHWARLSDGDARKALGALEVAVLSQRAKSRGTPHEHIVIDLACAEESIQAKAVVYDGTGDEHYDVTSAFIKSMRASDADATAYWLARMLEAGEDPRFIARRIAILASEDIGNADPRAISVAAAAWTITERVGMPECGLTLAQAAIYMACAPKSNASAVALWEASRDVREGRTLPVPIHLRDAHYAGAKSLGHGEGYVYPHDSPEAAAKQDCLPERRVYYRPSASGDEQLLREHLARRAGRGPEPEHVQEPIQGADARAALNGPVFEDDRRAHLPE